MFFVSKVLRAPFIDYWGLWSGLGFITLGDVK